MKLTSVKGTLSGNGITESAIASMDFTKDVKSATDLIIDIDDNEGGIVLIKWQYGIINNSSTPFSTYCTRYYEISDFNSKPDLDNLKEVIVNTFSRFSLESNLILKRYDIPIEIKPITSASEECDKAVQQLLGELLPLVENEHDS